MLAAAAGEPIFGDDDGDDADNVPMVGRLDEGDAGFFRADDGTGTGDDDAAAAAAAAATAAASGIDDGGDADAGTKAMAALTRPAASTDDGAGWSRCLQLQPGLCCT